MAEGSYSIICGFGLSGLLTIAFIVLKLCGVVAWKWVWVLSPIWIELCLVVLLFIIYLITESLKD